MTEPKALRIHIRDPRLRDGRMDISAQTSDPAERDRRLTSVMQLLDSERGREIVERLRGRKLKIEAVHDAVRTLDLGSLDPAPEEEEPTVRPVMLGETIDDWFRVLEGADRSPETIETYAAIVRALEAPLGVRRETGGRIIEDVAVGSITRSQGERWLTEPKKTTGGKPWAPSTQTVAHSIPAQLWDRAIAEDEERAEKYGTERSVTRNFWRRQGSRKGVKAARIRKTRVEFLQRDEAARLLRKIKGTPYAAWVATGIYAGLRPGETANLRTGIDVDMDARLIRVQPRKGEESWRTKSDNSVRDVPMHPRLARWLKAHMAAGYAGELYVFRQPGKDRPIGRSTWRTWAKTAFEAGGIRYGRKKDALTAHSLRHTFASWLTIADVHPLKIARLMGATVEEVMRTYAHLVPSDLDAAIRRLSGVSNR